MCHCDIDSGLHSGMSAGSDVTVADALKCSKLQLAGCKGTQKVGKNQYTALQSAAGSVPYGMWGNCGTIAKLPLAAETRSPSQW